MAPSVFQLQCTCNEYRWGRVGKASLAATLCSKTPGTDFKIEDKPYSEMWMGDYPVLPAKLLKTGEDLHKVIDENKKALLGDKCIEKFGDVLPFLPKILSIAKALPLQIHPNKEISAKLHKEKPDQFTDPNHKPEIAIALGPFEVFAGWKPTAEIEQLFDNIEPLQKFLPSGGGKQTRFDNDKLKQICYNILQASDDSIRQCQKQLAEIPKAKLGKQAYMLDLLPRLQQQYSQEDAGNLIALVTMNFLTLDQGDAIYVPADAPHAYLSGNIVECMARSNNVLNTGFCPRADRDSIELFSASLTFSPHSAMEVMLSATKSERGKHGKTLEYKPPMSEFNMLMTKLARGEQEVVSAIAGPSVIFATSGDGKMEATGESFDMKEGYIFFVGQGVEVALEGDLEVYRAYAE